jgi:hypothetical protein
LSEACSAAEHEHEARARREGSAIHDAILLRN